MTIPTEKDKAKERTKLKSETEKEIKEGMDYHRGEVEIVEKKNPDRTEVKPKAGPEEKQDVNTGEVEDLLKPYRSKWGRSKGEKVDPDPMRVEL